MSAEVMPRVDADGQPRARDEVECQRHQDGEWCRRSLDADEHRSNNDGANYPPEGVSGRHTQGGIQVTFGGTVNYVRLTDWKREMAETNRNRLWCYPNSPDGGDPVAGHVPQ